MVQKKTNFTRMLTLIDEVFATRNDPDQIQVTNHQMKKLKKIHPLCLSEYADENGPLICVLMIPTTNQIMQEFLINQISEKELLDKTPINTKYDTIYLCSVTTLPELRGLGKTKALCINTIKEMCRDNPITDLFVWPFSIEGLHLAQTIATNVQLKLNVHNKETFH